MYYQESIDKITEIFNKYNGDPYMIEKIQQFICGKLPRICESFKNTYIIQQQNEEEMHVSKDTFIQNFLNNNTYLYHSPTTTFYLYDHLHYIPYSEDDILHHVLSTLSKHRELSSWKKSTKIQIMCRIKQNALLKSIPNSETIQQVLELLKPLFTSKTEMKYFLTILGDTILKKNSGLVHFISAKSKSFLRELDILTVNELNLHSTTTFKSKYYEHEYQTCRFVPIMDSISNDGIWRSCLREMNIIDLICVATHYSIRYDNSDRFIEKINTDSSLINYVFFIKDRTPEYIVQQFIKEYIQVLPPSNIGSTILDIHTINWKNMFYLWKHFLDQHRIPTIIFQQNLKQILIGELEGNYDKERDQFHRVYSTFIPTIQPFLNFWNETITKNDEEIFEMEEIITLYKRWNPQSNLQEIECLDLIAYFFPGFDIIENKYISIECSLWSKKEDIKNIMGKMNVVDTCEKKTIYQLYEKYCISKRAESENPLIVSMQYFEKYIVNHLDEYIDIVFFGDS